MDNNSIYAENPLTNSVWTCRGRLILAYGISGTLTAIGRVGLLMPTAGCGM